LSVPMKGSKTFIYPFTVSKPGTYTIPAVSFSFFDRVSAVYKTLQTEPLVVTVSRGTWIANNPYLKKKVIQSPDETTFISNYGLYFAIGILLLAGLIFWRSQKNISRKKFELLKTGKNKIPGKEVEPEIEAKPEFVIPGNPLKEAHEKLMEQNSTAFYSVLDTSFKKYLSARFKVPAEELTKKRLNEELDKYNVGLGTSLLLSSLLEDVEQNLYAPPSNANHLKAVYEKASEVISLLDKQVG
jgi:hypothetical protein